MKAEETNFLKFLNSPKKMFIPIYQRAYNWKIKECKQLLNDIIRTGKDDSISGHFIGSVVYVEKGLYQVSAVPKLLVIDGQQRLTTLTLLISALCKKIKESKEGTELNAERLSKSGVPTSEVMDDFARSTTTTPTEESVTERRSTSYLILLASVSETEPSSRNTLVLAVAAPPEMSALVLPVGEA